MKIDIRTLNAAFETFAENHKMINSFHNSEVETISSEDRVYPLMWVGYPDFDFRQNAVDQNINIMFLNKHTGNYIDTASDMLLIAEDFHSTFTENLKLYGFVIDTNLSGNIITSSINGDEIAGVAITPTAKIHMSRNEYIIPTE